MKNKLFISSAIDSEKLPQFQSEQSLVYGKAHYSWKIIENLYKKGFENYGINTIQIARPEIYQNDISRKIIDIKENDIHISIKPIEYLRTLPGVKNIFVSGWEFPEFSNTAYNDNPFNNHISILKHADEIWCWSDFTKKNLQAHGLLQAYTVPPPALLQKNESFSNINSIATLALNTSKQVTASDIIPMGNILKKYEHTTKFFSMLNPFDRRKQILKMLEGFDNACKINNNIILIIKLIIDNISTTLVNIQEILTLHYGYHGINDKIIFIGEKLSDGQISQLMRESEYYLCTSSSEGLNLPMIEAMSHGNIPISTNVTAMADYINKDNAILLEYNQEFTSGNFHALDNFLQTTHFPPIDDSITSSILVAANLKNENKIILKNNAINTVIQKYSLNSFSDNLSKQLKI